MAWALAWSYKGDWDVDVTLCATKEEAEAAFVDLVVSDLDLPSLIPQMDRWEWEDSTETYIDLLVRLALSHTLGPSKQTYGAAFDVWDYATDHDFDDCTFSWSIREVECPCTSAKTTSDS